MVHKHSTVSEAYSALGLEQGSSLEVVKSTYRQLALRTHPDKNPGNEDATAQFQRLSEAYNVLLKHFDRASAPPRGPFPHSHSHGGPFGPFGSYDDDDDDDGYDDNDEYDNYEEDYEEDLSFYMFLFEELLRGRANRYASMKRGYPRFRPQGPPETAEQYEARMKASRQAQEAAEERRKHQEALRKAAREKERERERQEAEHRQREKAESKKAQAEASRKSAAQAVRTQQERTQQRRSAIFAAARKGNADEVKKGVWEDNVDASGGEVLSGCDVFVKSKPSDAQETLIHIAARNGDASLVEWLDAHSADPEERNSEGLTAFHIALRLGYISILRYFVETYAPVDEDSKAIYDIPQPQTLLRYALECRKPEVVWLILDKGLCNQQEIADSWSWLSSNEGMRVVMGEGAKKNPEYYEEIRNIMMTYGGFTPPPTPTTISQKPPSQTKDSESQSRSPTLYDSEARNATSSESSAEPSAATGRSRYGRGSGKRRPPPHIQRQSQQSDAASSNNQPPNQYHSQPDGRGRSRGRGRGRGRGQGRGHGRGNANGFTRGGIPQAST